MLTLALTLALAVQRLPQRVTFIIPAPLAERAKLKAKLHDALFQSIKNDSENILDFKLEKNIGQMELQLLKGKEHD